MFGFHLSKCSKDVIETCPLQKDTQRIFAWNVDLTYMIWLYLETKLIVLFLKEQFKVPSKLKNARILTFEFRRWIFLSCELEGFN
jgi:hypothetical protein